MKVWDVFDREGWVRYEHGDGSRVYGGSPGETWIATVSSKEVAVKYYCQKEVYVIRDREGVPAECEDYI